eukprot:Skav205202  [mRNA]  locus=scaffold376:97111:102790:+ [translate_table: standard]
MDQLQVDVAGKRIFMRVDFNVPQDRVLDKGAKAVVLASHLGRPDGSVVAKFSMAPVAKVLEETSEKLGKPVIFCKDCVGEEVEATCADPAPGSVILLENLRFHVEEEGKGVDPEGLSERSVRWLTLGRPRSLRKLADVYCNDAFGTAHRAHSSMAWVGEGFEVKCAGDLMGKDCSHSSRLFQDTCLAVCLCSSAVILTWLALGLLPGSLLAGDGMSIGSSLYDDEGAKIVPDILAKAHSAEKLGVKIILPVDFTCSSKFGEDGEIKEGGVSKETGIPDGFMGLDCGPKSIEENAQAGLPQVTHCSTGGGASLELLEGKELPGVAALNDKWLSCGGGSPGSSEPTNFMAEN